LTFSKKENDKRNTYIQLTEEGEKVFYQIVEGYDPEQNAAFQASMPLKEIFGKFPEIIEMMTIVRNIYGDDFMEIFEKSFNNIEHEFTEDDGKLRKKENLETELV